MIGLRGASVDAILAAATAAGWLPDRRADDGDVSELLTWGDRDEPTASVSHALGTTLVSSSFELDRDALLDRIAALPFELACVASLHPEWRTKHAYRAPSFSELLPPHGWLCAFRGRGHERLVSRRWLHQDVWTLHARQGDLSFVELHALDADSETALEQARPAHRRMGISDEGGFIQTGFVFTRPPTGFYVGARKVLEVVVHGRASNASSSRPVPCAASRA